MSRRTIAAVLGGLVLATATAVAAAPAAADSDAGVSRSGSVQLVGPPKLPSPGPVGPPICC